MSDLNSHIIPFNSAHHTTYNAEREKAANVIGERLTVALRDHGISKKDLCLCLKSHGVNVSHSAIGKWTNGLTVPSAYQLLAICHALDIEDGLSYFTGNYVPCLNKTGMDKVRSYKDDLIASGKYKPQSNSTYKIHYIEMPISNLRVSAGTGAFLDEGNFEMVSFPENTVPLGADFGIRVSGNSMEPVYHDGQIVWVQHCSVLSVGQVGVFVYNGEGYLKQYNEKQPDDSVVDFYTDSYGVIRRQPVMVSYNQDYPELVVQPESQFQIVGRVL